MYFIVEYAQGLFYCLKKRNIKMETDLNNADSVDQQDLTDADSVNQQDLNKDGSVDQQVHEGKLADGTDENKTVKYVDLKKATDRATVAEEQAAYAQRQLEIIQANAQVNVQPGSVQQPQQAKSTYEQAMLELGLTDDDLYGPALVKVENRKAELDMAWVKYQTAHSANQQFINSHTDFMEVVGNIDPSTQKVVSWSSEALSLQQKKPYLASAFQTAQGAYQAVLDERKLKELENKVAINQEQQVRQDVDVATQPLGGSAAGGGGVGDTQSERMMTREQVLEVRGKLDADEI